MALFFIKVLILAKNAFVFVGRLAFKPGAVVLRLFYYNLILPLYKLYLFARKKLGVSRLGRGRWFTGLLINKRLTYFLLIGLTLLFVYFNFVKVNRAVSSEEVVGKTLLAKLVFDELVENEELIEEYQTDSDSVPAAEYFSSQTYLRSPLAFDWREPETGVIEPTPPSATPTPRGATVEYTVKVGDTVSSIAKQFGISVNTVLWENNLTANSYIKPGNKLKILPTSGVTYKIAKGDNLAAIAKRHGVEAGVILEVNHITNANELKIGQLLIIPGGKKVLTSGLASGRQPSGAVVGAPQGSITPVAGAKMNWPTRGRISQYYSWRHSGLDIATKNGSLVYAAEAGTVIEAGWNSGGYGYQIIINHGGGKQTRYAHLSKFAVDEGEEVAKGQNIAFVGSTGRSTGPHLHFEVMLGGRRYNPLNYLSY